jgi:hypothetical protein
MGQLVQISDINQKMLVNVYCPGQVTFSCTNQILSDKQECEIRVQKYVVK